jgi:hypothetical protein
MTRELSDGLAEQQWVVGWNWNAQTGENFRFGRMKRKAVIEELFQRLSAISSANKQISIYIGLE